MRGSAGFPRRAPRFNYIGDTQWMRGRIERVEAASSLPAVDVSIEGVNQRGETTCTGEATVLLCGPDGVPPLLPELRIDDLLPTKL